MSGINCEDNKLKHFPSSFSIKFFAVVISVQLVIVLFYFDAIRTAESHNDIGTKNYRNSSRQTGLIMKHSLRSNVTKYVIAPHYVLTEYPYWNIMHVPTDSIRFVPSFKNPCFYAESAPNSCAGKPLITTECDDVMLHCLPYFLLVGFAKGGTTDLHAKITAHQQVGWRKLLSSMKKSKDVGTSTQ